MFKTYKNLESIKRKLRKITTSRVIKKAWKTMEKLTGETKMNKSSLPQKITVIEN